MIPGEQVSGLHNVKTRDRTKYEAARGWRLYGVTTSVAAAVSRAIAKPVIADTLVDEIEFKEPI